MNIKTLLGYLFVLAIVAGCGKEGAMLEPLPLSQVQSRLESAFKNCTPEIQASVREAVEAFKTTNSPKALFVLQDLNTKPGLTPAQHQLAARGMLTANSLMQTAAAGGDQEATEVIQFRRMNK